MNAPLSTFNNLRLHSTYIQTTSIIFNLTMWKKLRSQLIYILFLICSVTLLLEGSYRLYLFDFYGSNLRALNPSEAFVEDDRETILVIGDSFSADLNSYVGHLRNSFPEKQIINAAIPGTCPKQHQLLFNRRIKRFKPQTLIYQLYVGNDLFEWRHPSGNGQISTARQVYWWLSDRIWVLGYINAKLPHIRQAFFQDLPTGLDPKILEAYHPDRYSGRSKIQFKAEPNLIEASILLKGKRKKDMRSMTKAIQDMIANVPVDCQVYILVMPHCMQIGDPYQQRMQEIGASMEQADEITKHNYPFLTNLKKAVRHPHIQWINPLPLLQAADSTQAVFYENDPHLNPYGQQLVGELLVEKLEAE